MGEFGDAADNRCRESCTVWEAKEIQGNRALAVSIYHRTGGEETTFGNTVWIMFYHL